MTETSTWPEVDGSPRRLLLLPLGSTEQHGPHLPLNTDTAIALGLAQYVQQQVPEVGLAPAMPYGASGEHADFPGTLSIGTQALTSVLTEFTRHAARHWRHVLVVNGHGGNIEALHAASRLVKSEGRSLSVFHAASSGHRADAHAGYRETSIMLHLDPSAVRLSQAALGNTSSLADLLPELQNTGVRSVSPNGILGDPRGATADDGGKIFQQMAASLFEVVSTLLLR